MESAPALLSPTSVAVTCNDLGSRSCTASLRVGSRTRSYMCVSSTIKRNVGDDNTTLSVPGSISRYNGIKQFKLKAVFHGKRSYNQS